MGKYHNFSILTGISWIIKISQMNDARDNVFHNHFVIGAISLLPKSTTDTTFVMQ